MSQPYGAFMQVRIARADLVHWLEAPLSDPARWTDWRAIGGSWHIPSGIGQLADATDADMVEKTDKVRAWLARYGSNRAALRDFTSGRDAAAYRRFTYDPVRAEFVAGTLFYDETLIAFLAFLTVVRGIADYLAPNDGGVAVIHDYAFPDDDETPAAVALGPGRTSRLLAGEEREGAVAAFQPIADAMLADREVLPVPEDHLDALR